MIYIAELRMIYIAELVVMFVESPNVLLG